MRTLGIILPGTMIACLIAIPARAQEIDPDAPIATAPREELAVRTEGSLPEAVLTLPPPIAPGPWLTKDPEPRACDSVRAVGVQRGSQFHGVDLAPGELVSRTTYQVGCDALAGNLSVALSTTMLVTESGKFGARGPAEAMELKIAYATTKETRIGDFDLAFFTTYRGYDITRGIDDANDDYTTVGFEVGYTRWFGKVMVRPYLQSEKWNPVNYVNSLHFWGVHGQIGMPTIWNGWFQVTVGNPRNENSTYATEHKHMPYAEGSIEWGVGYGVSLLVGVRYDRYGAQDAKRGHCIARDARVFSCSRDGTSVPLPQVNPFFELAHRRSF